jgi:hypothetical protein
MIINENVNNMIYFEKIIIENNILLEEQNILMKKLEIEDVRKSLKRK